MDRRESIGFALAPVPFIAPLLLLFGIILFSAPDDSGSAMVALFQLLAMAYGATLLVGVPVHLVLRRKQRSSLSAYLGLTLLVILALAGTVAVIEQVLPPALDDNPFRFRMWSLTGLKATVAFAAAASVSSFVFWRLVVRSRTS